MRLLIAFCCFYWMQNVSAVELPPPHQAYYSVEARGLSAGEGTRRLTYRGDGTYVFESISQTVGIVALFRDDRIEERSVFEVIKGRVRPLEYRFDHVGSKKQKHQHIIFDWKRHLAKSAIEGNTWEVPLNEGMLDKFVYQIALVQLIKEKPSSLELNILDDGKVKIYPITFLGEETIETEAGQFLTWKYARMSENRQTVFWCAPSLYYLPVRVAHTEKGETVSTVLNRFEKTVEKK